MRLEPLVRCRAPKDTLTYVERFDPEAARRVRAAIPPDVLRTLEDTPRGHLLPLATARQVTHAWGCAMPREQAVGYLTGTVLGMFESPLLKPMIAAGMRVLGARPSTLMRLFPTAWKQVYVNCCEVSFVSTGASTGELHFTDVHPDFLDSFEDYTIVIEGIVLAGCSLCEHDGAVDFVVEPEQGRALARLAWTARDWAAAQGSPTSG